MENEISYCGIDIGLRTHTVCLMNIKQEIVRKFSIKNDLDGLKRLEENINRATKICLEPTGYYSINLFIYFWNRGYDIRFCGTASARNFRKSMFGAKKHDNLDCIALAKYRIVHEDKTFDGSKLIRKLSTENPVCETEYFSLNNLVHQYRDKTKLVAVLKNKIKGLIDLRFPETIQIFPSDRGCQTVLKTLDYPKKDILDGKVRLKRLVEIQEKLKNSIGQYDLKIPEFKGLVAEFRKLNVEIKQIKFRIKKQLEDKGYVSLLEYKGLNVINTAVLLREIKDIGRFYKYSKNGCFNKKRSIKAFKEYMGMAVTYNQSGKHEGGHVLVKSGNMVLRSILFMLAMTYISMKPASKPICSENATLEPYKFRLIYEQHVKRGKKKLVAITKVMSKIATDLFFVLKSIQPIK